MAPKNSCRGTRLNFCSLIRPSITTSLSARPTTSRTGTSSLALARYSSNFVCDRAVLLTASPATNYKSIQTHKQESMQTHKQESMQAQKLERMQAQKQESTQASKHATKTWSATAASAIQSREERRNGLPMRP